MKQDVNQGAAADAVASNGHPGTERVWHATYVLYERVRDYLACGWMVALPNGPAHHHHYGIVMEWRCACAMARPR